VRQDVREAKHEGGEKRTPVQPQGGDSGSSEGTPQTQILYMKGIFEPGSIKVIPSNRDRTSDLEIAFIRLQSHALPTELSRGDRKLL
jgi:hypothetical protein